jgi:hypothetical protein
LDWIGSDDFCNSYRKLRMLLLYIRMKIDWLGYDYVKSAKDWATTKQA